MSVSLMQGAAAAATPAQTPTVQGKPKGTSAAVDVASAKAAARLSGHRVEALSERTETSTTWVNKDGSLTTELSAGPVRFERDGAWVNVDVDLRAVPGGVEPVAHPGGLRLAGRTGTPARSLAAARQSKPVDLVTLGEGDQQIQLQWKGGLPEPKLDGTRAEYVNAVPGADVVVEATRTGFEQFVEIKQRPATDNYSYTLPLKAKGLKVKQLADGSVLFTDRKNRKQAVMPAPVMWDATVDETSGEHTRRVPVAMKVVKKGSGVDLVITPDAEFLSDPKTKFPVTVDPSTSALSNVFDTYVQQGETVDLSTDTELDWGNPGTTNGDGTPRTAQSFISWNSTPLQDALVTSAKLSLWNFHSGNPDCKAYPWEVWASGAASTSSRWTNRPTMTVKKATSSETRGNAGCAAQPDGWINADVTTLVQEWASAKATRGHMGLRATSESLTTQWKRVNSANAASNPPKLVVNYNFRPKTGTKQEAGPPFFSYSGSYMVNTTTPTLRDTFVDADGDKVNGTFQIFDNATNTQVGDVIVSKYVASGSAASVTVPAGVLTSGKTYKFRTSPYDGTHYNNGWSAWKTFTVDTAAPSSPASITSTDYPTGQWVKGAGQAGTFTVTPPASDHNWLEWSLDGVAWTKVATGGASTARSISLTPPKDGTHTLQVRSVDKADNKSEPREYIFHAGPGGFLQPLEGERTARRLPLAVEAEAGKFDQVSFSWRRSEADAWARIPAADVTSGGEVLGAWPVPLVSGKNAPLVWNATSTVDPDGTVQIKADFTGPDDASRSTDPLTVVIDSNADAAATTEVGPGSLNLLTGDYTLSGEDASFFGMSVTRSISSRTPGEGAKQEGQAAIFGAEWVSGTVAETSQSDYTYLEKVSDTALRVVTQDQDKLSFTANAAKTGWIPEPGAEALTLKGSFSGSFSLTDTSGTVTTFAKPTAIATTWQVTSSLLGGLSNTATTVSSETVVVDGKTLARPKRIIAPTSAATAAACEANPATKGCRVLEFVYATSTTATGTQNDADFGDFTGQVKQIRLWATAPGASAATATAVTSYRYDSEGRLRQTWDPRIGQQAETQYAYHEGRITWLDPAGQLPYTFTYGNAASGSAPGSGMLLNVSQPRLKQGTADQTDGNAVSTVVYGVALSGAKAPNAMNAAAIGAWGQSDAPTDATAVFPPDSLPASNSGTDLDNSDYQRATVHYLNASGRQVNTAEPGGHIATVEYNHLGSVVRELAAGNRELALGATAAHRETLTDLGIIALPSAERAHLLSSTQLYDESGARLEETLGPIHRVDLTGDLKDGTTVLAEAGSSVPGRSWTVHEYDEGRPTDGTAVAKNQVTMTITGTRVRDYYSIMGDKRVTETQYDWAKGLPTLVIEDSGGLNLTTTTVHNAEGRITDIVPPGGTGEDAASRVTAYWKATGTGWCEGRPEWAGLECWSGPAGTITGGGSNPSEVLGATTEYNYWGDVAKRTEDANGVTRTTVVDYDDAGRPTTTTITGDLGTPVPVSTVTYDPESGQAIRTSSPTGGTVTKAYDALGREISYTDADGGTTTTEYDQLNRVVKETDSVPSTVTYSYDTTIDPRGLPTKISDSVAGDFHVKFDADGAVTTEQLPGGYTLNVATDPSGAVTSRAYTRDSDGISVYTDTVARSAHGQVLRHAGWSEQTYRYDAAGRLSTVDDTIGNVCTRRSYTFDKRANRTSLTTATAAPGAACPTTGGTTKTHTYDSSDRITDAGYAYDALGRTTAAPGNGTIGYYTNDLVRQQVSGNKRQTWSLDALHRFRGWTLETSADGSTWTRTASKLNHYDSDGDNPRWIVEDTTTGLLTRNIRSASGDLAATSTKTGDTVLQLTSVHGDVALQLPLDTSKAPVAFDSDEYGRSRAGQESTRYGWLGNHQRSSETVSSLMLMGVRLYNPDTGRFLSVDPVYGGNENAYEYCGGDPVACTDTTGKLRVRWWKPWWSPKYFIRLDLNRSETRWVAFGTGSAAGFLSWAKDIKWIPKNWKHAITAVRGYLWYFTVVAGYAVARKKCTSVISGALRLGGNVFIPIPPTIWTRRC
ncbi:DNRLRE domain-containing protein [Streptomyces sp. NPDC086077]|uniref:DNRLRE domain-containing protein n=1 Tax=Streptomyces sp. NPDC086077 TaxID=3154862 RepID=UPI0034282978